MMSRSSGTPIERWVAVLDAFAGRDDWGVRELATAIGLSATAAHRILHQMTRAGLLAPGMARGHFRVGPELSRLSVLIAERLDVRRIARPILEATAKTIGETVILAQYSPARGRFWAVDAVESSHTIRYIWESLRSWNDLYRGASGKGILAFLPEHEREAILAKLDEPERSSLREALDTARAQGFVISRGERFAGAVGVSAPIRDAIGRVIGDLVAGWPDNRNDSDKERRIAEAIVEASSEVSRQLGFTTAVGPAVAPG